MNILFILGNGFDKAQGLDTCYTDFYKEYQELKAESDIEERLKKEIQSDYETWADLEEGLGKYSSSFSDVNVFRGALNILNKRLKAHLKKQVLRIGSLGLSKEKLIQDLLHPEEDLEIKQKTEYIQFLSTVKPENVFINCVTLNYTNTFESVLNKKDPFLGNLANIGAHVYFNGILHLHGSIDNIMLMGVNDVGQIANETFRNDPELKVDFVKPEINRGCENLKNETFSNLIKTAHVIVLFGVSLGVTDLMWWRLIGERFDDPKCSLRIVYYPYDTSRDTELLQSRKLQWSGEYISFLKERMGIKQSVDELRKFIFVGINKPYLKLK